MASESGRGLSLEHVNGSWWFYLTPREDKSRTYPYTDHISKRMRTGSTEMINPYYWRQENQKVITNNNVCSDDIYNPLSVHTNGFGMHDMISPKKTAASSMSNT